MREAIAAYDEAIHRNPTHPLAFYNRGTAYLYLGQYQPALNDYSEAIRVSPGDAEVYAARAFCYALLGRNGEAQQDVKRAAKLGFARTFLERAIEEVKRKPQLLRGQ
jgi:tetratricopeptide (TPR) repeat protein